MLKLTERGIKAAQNYISNLQTKRKEILDAGLDTAEDTILPTVSDIEADVNFFETNEEGDYYNSWGVTDNYDADNPLSLVLGKDIVKIA